MSRLTRVTVNLIPRAVDSLDEAAKLGDETKTEVINRAIQLYAWLQQRRADGHTLLTRDPAGTIHEITML